MTHANAPKPARYAELVARVRNTSCSHPSMNIRCGSCAFADELADAITALQSYSPEQLEACAKATHYYDCEGDHTVGLPVEKCIGSYKDLVRHVLEAFGAKPSEASESNEPYMGDWKP